MRDKQPVGFLFENPDDPDRQPDPFRYDAILTIVICIAVLLGGCGVALWMAHKLAGS